MPLFHHIARAVPGTRLFRDVEAAQVLWGAIVGAFPRLDALCLMPDHLHLALPHPDDGRLSKVLSGYARWRTIHRGAGDTTFAPRPPPIAIGDPEKARRMIRHILMNPVRRHLVADPLAWDWSTHRDAVGFAARPAVPRDADPEARHDWVTEGRSSLPRRATAAVPWDGVIQTIAAICRARPDDLRERGLPRTLAVKTGWTLGLRDPASYDSLGVARSTVYRIAAAAPDAALEACLAAAGDARFRAPIADAEHGGWWLYRHQE